MEQLTKEELLTLAQLLSGANVPVKDAKPYSALLDKLLRMAEKPVAPTQA